MPGVIAIPVAYFLLRSWLNDYAFHIEIGIWFFLLPLLLILCNCIDNSIISVNKGGNSKPGEKFENRMKSLNHDLI